MSWWKSWNNSIFDLKLAIDLWWAVVIRAVWPWASMWSMWLKCDRGHLHVSGFAARFLLTWHQILCWISFCRRKIFRLNRCSVDRRTPNKNVAHTSIFSPRFSTGKHFGRPRCHSVDNGASVRKTKWKNDCGKCERPRNVLCHRTILLFVVTVERYWHNRSMSFKLRSWHVLNMDLKSNRTRSPGCEKFSTNSSANRHGFDQKRPTLMGNSTNLRRMECPRALALSTGNRLATTLAQWSHERNRVGSSLRLMAARVAPSVEVLRS